MNKAVKYAITILLIAAAITGFILFEIVHVKVVDDETANPLIGRSICYLIIAALFLWLQFILGNSPYLSFKEFSLKNAIWCLPCLLVAIVNYPFSALASGQLAFIRLDLLWLYSLYVIGISLVEEMVFRGILLFLLIDLFKNQKLKYFLSVLISSAVFSLFHLANLFIGMDIGSVLLQMLYTFLIGAMFAVITIKTKSIWMAVIIHALFDFGGLLSTTIAAGDPWDTVFWILTITCGILCAGHIILSLINLERKHAS